MEPDAGYDGDGEPPPGALPGGPGQRLGFGVFPGYGLCPPAGGASPKSRKKLWLAYTLRPWAPGAEKPTKPYLVEAADYEEARERAAERVDVTGL